MFDAAVPHGWGYYLKSHYPPPLTDAAVDALAGHAWRNTSPPPTPCYSTWAGR
jgi:hypothetical protein